ncbi:hypothetical protein Pfo_009998 [Paulownia fortunei]|nr:hypothetical protein Pfo_009998 [Paulownia fortunei]
MGLFSHRVNEAGDHIYTWRRKPSPTLIMWVIISCLNCFLGNGSLYCFEYGVAWLAFIAKFRGGTCTTAKSDPLDTEIHRAIYFAGQTSSVAGALSAAFLPLTLLFISSTVVITSTTAMYSLNKYATDIGVGVCVIKVKVEDIALFHGNQLGVKDACSDVVDVNDTQT